MILEEATLEAFGYYASELSYGSANRNIKYNQTVKGKTEKLKAEGFKTIIIWESDLKRSDAEKFVMHIMRTEGII